MGEGLSERARDVGGGTVKNPMEFNVCLFTTPTGGYWAGLKEQLVRLLL